MLVGIWLAGARPPQSSQLPAAAGSIAAPDKPRFFCPAEMQPARVLAPLPPPPKKAPDFDRALPIEQVWPDAVRTLPATLPDGRAYHVEAAIGHDRYLVDPTDRGVTYEFGIYELNRGRYFALVMLPAGWFIDSPTFDVDVVVWQMHTKGGYPSQVWAARLSTCTVNQIATEEL